MFTDGALIGESLREAVAVENMTARVDARSHGATGKGTADETAALQSALDAAAGLVPVVVPPGTYLVNGVATGHRESRNGWIGGGLRPPTGSRLALSEGATLKVIPNGSPGYACIYLGVGQDNVTITGGRIVGDRAGHDYATEPKFTTHEYGYGIVTHGAKDVTIDGVTISGFTGDGVNIYSVGNLAFPHLYGEYVPSERVIVKNCRIDGSRRNNVSVIGCDRVTIENCTITRAGYSDGVHDGTAPRFGIDIEGSGANGADWETPLNVTIRNNRFGGNVNGSVMNYNGYGVNVEGNFADNVISFGFGTETVIRGNVIKSAGTTGNGISSNWSAGMYRANSVVCDNVVVGFTTGISVQRDSVLVSGNHVSGFASTGISTFGSSDVAISGNHVTGSGAASSVGVNVGSSNGVSVAGNRLSGVAIGVSLSALKSTGVDVTGNTIAATTGFRALPAGCEATFTANTVRLTAGGRLDNIKTPADVVVDGNVIRSPQP